MAVTRKNSIAHAEDTDADAEQEEPLTIRRRQIDPTELTPKQLNRVLKNRQAAQASRERKRAYVDELEESRERLQAEATELRTRVQSLERDKAALASQVDQLKCEFDDLRALLLGRLGPKAAEGVEASGLLSHTAAPAAGEGRGLARDDDLFPSDACFRMTDRPTANPATNVRGASLPLINSDRSFLGGRRAAMPPSARHHCQQRPGPRRPHGQLARRPAPGKTLSPQSSRLQSGRAGQRGQKCLRAAAPLTLSLLSARTGRLGSLTASTRTSRHPKTLSGSTTTTTHCSRPSMTWQSLMAFLLSRYAPKSFK